MSVHWGGKGPGHVSRWPKAVGPVNAYSGATMLLDFLNPVLDPRITFSRGTGATRVNALGFIETVGNTTPRFDYDPVTLAPRGLLIEEARTNLLTYSDDWSNAVWTKQQVTITTNATLSPDGTANADKIAEDSSTAFHRAFQTVTKAASAVAYTYTVFVKAAERTTASVFIQDSGVFAQVDINLLTGALSNIVGAVSATNFGNGWWRVSVSGTSGTTTTALCMVASNNGGSFAGTAGSGIYAYGAQLEAGSFATSYIPTVASTVTRNADVATMTGTNFSSWYNQSEGTFVVGYDQLSGENKDIFMAGSAGGSFNPGSVGIYGAGTSIAGYVRSSSAYTAQANVLASLGNNIPLSAAVAYKVNDVAASAMGATPVVATPPNAMPTTVIELKIMGAGVTGGGKSGHIRQIAYFNTRLPNAQLQTLTAPSLATTLSLDFTSGSYNVGF